MHKATAPGTLGLLSLLALLLPPLTGRTQTTINVPRDQPTIQAGINAATDGNTVLVAPGTYVENIDFLGKAIIVTSSGGAVSTILDGGATGPVAIFQTAEGSASVLSGFTIQNAGGYGSNTTAIGIAGVVVSSSSPTILNNIITQNQCWDIEVLYGAPLVQGNTISSTQSPAEGCGTGTGAGVYINGNLPNGGTLVSDAGLPAVIKGNTIENITVPAAIGAAQAFSNVTDENGGAGIYVLGGSPLIENNVLRNNSAPGGNGGAILVAGGSGTTIAQNLIDSNSAGCGGGAISFLDVDVLIANNTVVDNTGGSAGLYSSCSDVSQIYSINFGLSSPNVIFVNNIISGSSVAPAVGCYSFTSAPSEAQQAIFDHNLLYNGGGSFFGPTCIDVSAKYGNVLAAPQFANAAQADFHLLQASLGVDAGNNSALGNISELSGTTLVVDLDGNPRVQAATEASYPIIDMGVYERPGAMNEGTTTIVLASSVYSGTPGDPMTLSATIQSPIGLPIGRIAFFLDGQLLGNGTINTAGTAHLDTVVPGTGTHSVYAAYQGANSFTPAFSVIRIVTGEGPPASKTFQTSLVIQANIDPQQYGQDVIFTIVGTSTDPNRAYTPSPITLSANQAVFGSVNLNREGMAHFTTKTLPVGFNEITASYAGDATHQASMASTAVTIQGSFPSIEQLTCNPLTIQISQTSVLSATASVAGAPATGFIIFTDDGTILGEAPLVNGTATWTYVGRATGEHLIQVSYPPFGQNLGVVPMPPIMCTVPPKIYEGVIVKGLPSTSILSVAPATGSFQTPTTMTATVTPTNQPGLGKPTGTVNFTTGMMDLGTVSLISGVAALQTIALPAGADAVTCVYSGDATYAPANCNTVAVTRSLAQPVLTITPSANDILALTPVTFTVALTATGNLVADRLPVVLSAGSQTFPLVLNPFGMVGVVVSNLLPGADVVSASFAGNANLFSANAFIIETVVASPSTTALSVAPSPGYVGQPVTLTAMVTAQGALVPIGGTVTFYDGTTVLGTGTLDQSRTATLTTSSLAAGTHSLTATYPGNSVFTGSTSQTVSETILLSSFTIALSPSTVTLLTDQSATVAIQLAGMGGFAGPLNLTCGMLPVNASANINPQVVTLPAGMPGTSTLTLNTASPTPVAAFRSRPSRTPAWPTVVIATLVLLVPWRRSPGASKLRSIARRLLGLTLTAAFLQTILGCGNRFYTLPGVAPGTYHVQITATDGTQNQQTATLTLVVPPR